MFRTIITASLAAAAVAAVASADDVVIDISGLDLADPAQAASVYEQVVDASRAICADLYLDRASYQIGYFERQRMYAACVKLTVAETIEAAGLPALVDAYASAAPLSPYAVASN